MTQFKNSLKIQTALAIVSLALLAACTKGGVSVGGSTSTSGGITLTTLNGVARASWKTDGTANIYENVYPNNFAGTCARGVNQVYVFINGTMDPSAATCDGLGNFVWSHTFTSDGTYNLSFRPVQVDGTVLTAIEIDFPFITDTVAPGAPTIVSPGTNPYTTGSANLTVSGTVLSTDGIGTMVTSDLGAFVYNATAHTFTLTAKPLTNGETRSITFKSVDYAANVSPATTLVVSFLSGISLVISDESGAGFSSPMTGANGWKLNGVQSIHEVSQTAGAKTASTPAGDFLFLGIPNIVFQ